MSNDLLPIKQHWGKHLLGGGITVLCLFALFYQVEFSEVFTAFTRFHWAYLILGIGSLAVGYVLRIIRWSMMLRAAGADATFTNCSAPFLGSIALNNILPFRIGDVIRALVFPKSMGISKITATSSLVVERLIDLMTLLASLAIGFFAIQEIAIPAELRASALTLAMFGGVALSLGLLFSGLLGVFFNGLAAKAGGATNLSRVYATLGGLLHGFNAMSRPKLLLTMLFISMLVWVGEAGLFYFVLLGTGIEGTPLVALLVMSVATLSTLIPSSPGYVGPFHLAAFTAISLVGGTAAQAGSYAVIVHLALWLPTTLVGILAIWMRPAIFKLAISQRLLKAQQVRKKNEYM